MKQKWRPLLIAYFAKIVLRLLLFTCRMQTRGVEELKKLSPSQPLIIALWHNRIALCHLILKRFAPKTLRFAAFVSKSRDGEILAALANSYKRAEVIRVPHNARFEAFQRMVSKLKEGKEVILITPDGPRGPLYEVKPGIIRAAKQAKAKILPLTWSANRTFELNTWDKFKIPKPFSKITVSFGPPIEIDEHVSDDMGAKLLAETLLALEEKPTLQALF